MHHSVCTYCQSLLKLRTALLRCCCHPPRHRCCYPLLELSPSRVLCTCVCETPPTTTLWVKKVSAKFRPLPTLLTRHMHDA